MMGAAYIVPFKSLNIMWNGSRTSPNYRAILMLLSIGGYDIINYTSLPLQRPWSLEYIPTAAQTKGILSF